MAKKTRHGSRPRTVLYVDEGVSFGGSLIVTAQLIKYLDPKKYRAVVVAEAPSDVLEYLYGDRAKWYRIPRAFNYRHWERAQDWLRPFGILRRPASYALTLAATLANVPYHVRLGSVILRERVDVIHHSNGHVRSFLALFRKPTLATMAGIVNRPYSRMERFLVGRLSAFIMISGVVKDHVIAAGGYPELTELIPNPCDPVEISDELKRRSRAALSIPSDAKVFGLVGRIVEWKGQREFLRAANSVLATIPESIAMIVGDAADGADAYFDEVRAMAAASPFADRIVFTGYMEDVSRAYAVMDVAVHASVEPEPFGLVVTEAMGQGIPIVASNIGAPPEIVEDGVDGFLVHPEKTQELASAIVRLLADDRLRAAMGENGRKKVLRAYNARDYAQRIQNLYDRALEHA